MVLSIPMVTTFVVYILLMLGIGFYAYFATKNFDDYILGGRSLGSFVTALSAGASDMSGWLLMGLPGAIYTVGLSESWIAVGLILGAYLNWKFVAGRLRVHTEVNNNALTLPDYFSHRFDDQSNILRVISAVIILVFFCIYCASGIVASARLFENTFHLSYGQAICIGAASTIIYTFIGGFLAVSWTDTIQASLMLFALILTPIFVILASGGAHASIDIIQQQQGAKLLLTKNLTAISLISLLGWGLGYLGQPHILARFMAARSKATIVTATRISMSWMILCLAGAVSIGILGNAYFLTQPDQVSVLGGNNETIFIKLATLLFNPWIAGIVLSAILAAVMSTLSCQLLVASSAITEDIYKAFFRKNASQSELVWVGRMMVLVVALIAILLALNPKSEVLNLVSYAWSGFGAAFGPVILISIFWRDITKNAALAGMIIGSITVIIWKNTQWFGLYEIIPGFFLATAAIILISKIEGGANKILHQRFDEANQLFQAEK